MAKYTDLEKMYKEFVKQTTQAMREVVPTIMTEAHKEAIVIEVYGKYEPTMYNGEVYDFVDRRYGDNGLLDEYNYLYEFDVNRNTLVITLYNETRGNQYAPNNQSGIYIDEIIVTGDNYSWKNSQIAKMGLKRDFYKVTEEIMGTPKFRNEIIKELNKRGLNVW